MKKELLGKTAEELHRMNFEAYGELEFPAILPTKDVERVDFIGFGERRKNLENYGCHFFIDDYRFQRVWNTPEKYLDELKQYKYVLAPDFSLYVDYPKALCVFNNYRKHWCARYWQEHGMTVIPVVNWIYEDSYTWCFDGDPINSVVAVSSKGVNNAKDMIKMFREGYAQMEKCLNPSKVLWFGKYCLEEPRENIVFCKTTFEDRIMKLRKYHNRNVTRK